MSKITVKSRGNFNNTTNFLYTINTSRELVILAKYGKLGVEALKNVTPRNTGLTADSWYYTIKFDKGSNNYTIEWKNSNLSEEGYQIAVMLQYGHATNNGGYVEGHDYINPAMEPIFKKLADEAWKEVLNS